MAPRFRVKKPHNAVKHGGYSTMGLLPGESPAEFEKMRKNLIDELPARGPLEEDIVCTIARLLWRKQNLSTFHTAKWAREQRNRMIREETDRRIRLCYEEMPDDHCEKNEKLRAASREAIRAADEEARNELGEYFELALDDLGTTNRLMADLEVEERLDAAIDKCIKRLLMLRGVKSMSVVAPSEPAQLSKPRSVNRSAA
jgi:hypothetical protein